MRFPSILLMLISFMLLMDSCTGQETKTEAKPQLPENLEPVTSFYTGNPNIVTIPAGGVCMMGGGTENDNAMRWFLNRAQGGDVLIMRASGSDGYNDYLYSELGSSVNSVETLVFSGVTEDESIIAKIDAAEAIWFAGGNQGKYVEFWKDNSIEDALQRAINRNVVIGGTSAGMAILGQFVWTGETIVTNFLRIPFLQGKITDTHFSERSRMDRLLGFIEETGAKGVAADEYTAICIDPSGLARVFGNEANDDIAFFIDESFEVISIKGTTNGSASFDLSTW